MENTGEPVDPAGTVMEGGAAATAGLELDKVTTAPPAGAGAVRVTIFEPVTLRPQCCSARESLNPLRASE